MKKLILMFAMGLGLAGFAQQQGKMPNQMEQTKNMTPEQTRQKHMEMLTKELNLNADQQQKVAALMAERDTKMKDLKAQKDALTAKGAQATAAEKDAMKQKMMDQKKDFEGKMKGVLTPDQFKKWMYMREEGMEKMKAKKGKK